MIDKITISLKTIIQVLKTSWFKILVIYLMMSVLAYSFHQLLPRIFSLIMGRGFSFDGSPLQQWYVVFEQVGQRGYDAVTAMGESNFAFLALYSFIQFVIQMTFLILLAGMATSFLLEVIKNGEAKLSIFFTNIRSAFRYMGGMWLTLTSLLFAGLIGDTIAIYLATPDFVKDSATFTAITFVVSASIIGLCVIFIRLAYLSCVRNESAERFMDSIRYSLHLTRGYFWLVVLMSLPPVAIALVVARYTRGIPILATLGEQFGVLIVLIVDAAVYMTLIAKTTKDGQTDGTSRLG